MSRKSHAKGAEFVFVPLGGVGEIGMNLYLYGYGREGAREWLIVDMGVTFGSETEPGIDVILPDIGFIEEEKHNIAMRTRIISGPWPICGRLLPGSRFTPRRLPPRCSNRSLARSASSTASPCR